MRRDHSISIGAVRAAVEAYPGISILHLDAHADLRESYQGTIYSHACFGRRAAEVAPLVQAGIRSMSAVTGEAAYDTYLMYPNTSEGSSAISKWSDGYNNDFAARMDWTIEPPEMAAPRPERSTQVHAVRM